MDNKSLTKIRYSLEKVFRELNRTGQSDTGIRQRYAEYLVASVLAREKKGLKVQILDERAETSADICLISKKGKLIRIEVKSAKENQAGWAFASFGMGEQIRRKKFDYCVVLTFHKAKEKVLDRLVFAADELKEIATKPRPRFARHATNTCLLMCSHSNSIKQYEDYMQGHRRFEIERTLLRYPRKFKNAWGKIK